MKCFFLDQQQWMSELSLLVNFYSLGRLKQNKENKDQLETLETNSHQHRLDRGFNVSLFLLLRIYPPQRIVSARL